MNLKEVFAIFEKKGYSKTKQNKNDISFSNGSKTIDLSIKANDNVININNKIKHHQLTDNEILSILKFLKK